VARLRAEALSKPTSHTLVDSAQKEGKASETPDSRGENTGVGKPTLAMIEVMMSRARGLKSASLVVSASWTSASLDFSCMVARGERGERWPEAWPRPASKTHTTLWAGHTVKRKTAPTDNGKADRLPLALTKLEETRFAQFTL
jgi:hypothetical protein